MTQAPEQQPNGREEERPLKNQFLSDLHLEHGGTIPAHVPPGSPMRALRSPALFLYERALLRTPVQIRMRSYRCQSPTNRKTPCPR